MSGTAGHDRHLDDGELPRAGSEAMRALRSEVMAFRLEPGWLIHRPLLLRVSINSRKHLICHIARKQ